MMNLFKYLFFGGKEHIAPENNDFSDFFVNGKAKDKAKMIREVLREANEEQKAVIEEYQRSIKQKKVLAN